MFLKQLLQNYIPKRVVRENRFGKARVQTFGSRLSERSNDVIDRFRVLKLHLGTKPARVRFHLVGTSNIVPTPPEKTVMFSSVVLAMFSRASLVKNA